MLATSTLPSEISGDVPRIDFDSEDMFRVRQVKLSTTKFKQSNSQKSRNKTNMTFSRTSHKRLKTKNKSKFGEEIKERKSKIGSLDADS